MLKKLLKTKKEWVQRIEEYPPQESMGILEMCRKCYAFRQDNAWHFERPRHLTENDPEERIFVKFSQCPACIEEALAMYDMEYV